MTTQFVIPSNNILKDLEFYQELNFKLDKISLSELGRRRCFLLNDSSAICIEEWEQGTAPAAYWEVRVFSDTELKKYKIFLNHTLNTTTNCSHPDNAPYILIQKHTNIEFVIMNVLRLDEDVPEDYDPCAIDTVGK